MKKMKTECLPSEIHTKEPSKSFLNELSLQVTPKIQRLIEDKDISDNLFKTIRFDLRPEFYLEPIFKYHKNYMKAYISAYSTSLILCEIIICWRSSNGTQIYPWENLAGEISFDVCISDYNLKCLNKVIPMIYHPVIKSEDSGLHFDYQIFYGGQYLNLYFKENITPTDLSEVGKIIKEFFTEWNCSHDIKLHHIEIVKYTKNTLKIEIDLGGCGKDMIENIIKRMNIPKIKRIVFK
ncbi:MAG: hypothetical protein IJZ94_05360 [Clostridia bacterium]|nr:hypothetical protein [Clostridia bacterium]